jgi:hypothetical protein
MENHSPTGKHFSPVSFIAGLVIALGLFFLIYKLSQKSNAPQEKKMADTLRAAADAEPKKEVSEFAGEHFYKDHHHRHIDEDAEAIVVAPNEASSLERGNLSAKQKQLLELLPNAPSIYILGFKVTAYQNFYFDGGIPVVLTDKQIAGQVLHDALKDFSKKNFAGCFAKMELLLKENINDVNALFYSGMCCYYQDKCSEAIPLFAKVLTHPNNVFYQEARWFTALCFGKQGQTEAEKKSLREIADRLGFYADRAAEKLKSLP